MLLNLIRTAVSSKQLCLLRRSSNMQFSTARHQLYNVTLYSNTVKGNSTLRRPQNRLEVWCLKADKCMYIFRDNGHLAHLPPVMALSFNTVFYTHVYRQQRERERERERERGRQTDRQTDRQRQRQRDRETERAFLEFLLRLC